MSTRSYIGLLNKDGSVRSIYHHFDGYVKGGVGEILFNHYTTEDKINKLLDLGDMSQIGIIPEDDPKLWSQNLDIHTMTYDYDSDMCKTYRGRGETDVDARTYSSVEDFLDDCTEDFTYLFKDGKWYFRNWDGPLFEVSKALDGEVDEYYDD